MKNIATDKRTFTQMLQIINRVLAVEPPADSPLHHEVLGEANLHHRFALMQMDLPLRFSVSGKTANGNLMMHWWPASGSTANNRHSVKLWQIFG